MQPPPRQRLATGEPRAMGKKLRTAGGLPKFVCGDTKSIPLAPNVVSRGMLLYIGAHSVTISVRAHYRTYDMYLLRGRLLGVPATTTHRRRHQFTPYLLRFHIFSFDWNMASFHERDERRKAKET